MATDPFDVYIKLYLTESALTLAALDPVELSEKAIEESKRLTGMMPSYWLSHFLLGRAHAEIGQTEQAIEAYGEAVKPYPQHSLFFHRSLMLAQSSISERWKNNDEIIRINPTNAQAYNWRGVALFTLGRLEEASQDLDESLQLTPGHAHVYNNLGSVFYQLRQPENVVEDYNEAIKFNPRSAEYYANRALAYNSLDEDVEARRDFERAI